MPDLMHCCCSCKWIVQRTKHSTIAFRIFNLLRQFKHRQSKLSFCNTIARTSMLFLALLCLFVAYDSIRLARQNDRTPNQHSDRISIAVATTNSTHLPKSSTTHFTKTISLFPETLLCLLMVHAKGHATVSDDPCHNDSSANHGRVEGWVKALVVVQVLWEEKERDVSERNKKKR